MHAWLAAAFAQDVVLEHPRIVDADGVREADVLVVRDGRITHIGADPGDLDGLERRDVRGATVMPGLIDAHVHLSMAPGAAFVERTDAEEEARWALHLRSFVAAGVTAVLDTGIAARNAERLLAIEGPAPTIRLLGPLVSPPGGYVGVVIPELGTTPDAATLQEQLEGFDRFAPIGVKVTMETGPLRPIWPLHSDEVRAALNAQPRPLFVHAMHRDLAIEALDTLDVDVMVHGPDDAEGLVERLQGIPVITTLSVYDGMLTPHHPERLDTPLAQRVVPEDERAAVLDRKLQRRSTRELLRVMLPGLPGFLRGPVAGIAAAPGPTEKRRKAAGEALLALHRGGVPLVLGSDSGNWPVFLNYLHALSTILEAEALVDVGFTPAEVLRMGTLEGARVLGLEDELGTVAVGKRASLLVLERDPLADISAIREIRWVLHDGRIDSPDGWMSASER